MPPSGDISLVSRLLFDQSDSIATAHTISRFAGPVFNPSINDWTKFHSIHNGEIDKNERDDPDLRGIISKQEQKLLPEALEKAARFGMATNRLYIKLDSSSYNNQPALGAILSGFWLSEELLVTCAHGFDFQHLGTDTQSRALDQMQLSEATGCFVCLDDYAAPKSMPHPDDEMVQLLKWDFDNDVAIFRTLTHAGPALRHRHIIGPKDLDPLPPVGLRIFLVAYAVNDFSLATDHGKEFRESVQKRDEQLHKKVIQSKPKSVFDYTLINYKETASGEDWFVHLTIAQGIDPLFSQVYKPDSRAIAVGQIVAGGVTEESSNANPLKKILTKTHSIHIPAFHGCSGGIVATLIHSVDGLSARLVGILTEGNFTAPTNSMRTFTKDGKEWIENAVKEYARG